MMRADSIEGPVMLWRYRRADQEHAMVLAMNSYVIFHGVFLVDQYRSDRWFQIVHFSAEFMEFEDVFFYMFE